MDETQTPEAPTPEPSGGIARWSRLGTLGLIMVGLAPALMLSAAVLWGLDLSGEEPVFFGLLTVVPWIAAYLVWRFGTWSKVVGIVIALAGLGMLWWTVFSIGQPSSFFDFIPGTLVVPGAIIALASCIGALVARKRGHMSTQSTGGERRGIRLVFVVWGTFILASALLTVGGRDTISSAESTAETLTATDFSWDTPELSIPQGESLLVRNDDPFLHTFTIDELNISVNLSPGDEVVINLPSESGKYTFYCIPHTEDQDDPGEDDMVGQITIE